MTANRLQAVLDRAARSSDSARRAKPPSRSARPQARSRARTPAKAKVLDTGTVLVGAHLPPSYLRQLRLLAAEEGVTSNTLIREALDLLFVKKGRDKIRKKA